MPFTERWPEIVSSNPGGVADPLGESVADPTQPAVRLFEPRDIRLVIGRHQDPERELHCAAARADGVPIHRRIAGGGAVVLAPGSVVVALRMPRDEFGTQCYFTRVNEILLPVLGELIGRRPHCRGHGDLALCEDDGAERKILGASLRQTRDHAIYLGVLLVADLSELMRRYLAAPSRAPAYRAGREHAAFCTCLGRYGVGVDALLPPLRAACLQALSGGSGAASAALD